MRTWVFVVVSLLITANQCTLLCWVSGVVLTVCTSRDIISGLEKYLLVKTTCCSCTGPGFGSQHPRSQPPVTPVPGDTNLF